MVRGECVRSECVRWTVLALMAYKISDSVSGDSVKW